MLVLTRKTGEQIQIGDHIVVTVVRLLGGAVRLGVQAPDDARIIRGELAIGSATTGPAAAASPASGANQA